MADIQLKVYSPIVVVHGRNETWPNFQAGKKDQS